MNALAKFNALALAEKMLFLEAWLGLVAVRIALACRRFENVLAAYRLARVEVADSDTASTDIGTVRKIRSAIARAAPRVPFDAACLPQAMVAAGMLSRRGLPARMRLGGRRTHDSDWAFHAWTSSADVLATPADAQGHTPVAVFERRIAK